ncbi:MAG: hypothetical protein A2Y13_00665 [Planctomycetes bacterium GWC2_45_44]|nr:MAG: hypothetical protein A2Y13_00665 [Planctomycetes bacterium GWC2_45_44]HBR19002.1 hypothetical protein [Phycisphaerales bacterium]
MKTSVVIAAMVLAMMLGFCSVSQADHIPVVSVTTITYPDNYNTVPLPGHEFTYLIDDTGMSGDTRTLADTQDSNCTKYLSDGIGGPTGLQFDLGQNYAVGEIRIWNYVNTLSTDPNKETMFGMRDVYVTFYDEAGTYEYGGWDGTVPKSPKDPGNNPVSVVIDWSNVSLTNTVRYVRFYCESPAWNWSNGWSYMTGLGQVRFYEKGITDCEQAIELGYTLATDVNKDCYVDLKDLAIIALEWLDCMDPQNLACNHPWVP